MQVSSSDTRTTPRRPLLKIYCVLSAIRERKKSFVFTDGSSVSLDPRVGFFITMNPGWAARRGGCARMLNKPLAAGSP